jgi:hypothetical protein
MSRIRILFLLTVLLFGTRSVFATDYAVGTCKPTLTSYSTISEAVSSVPSGSTVEVCPGAYPEQVTILQPLTLEGIAIGNSDQAVITVPAKGLVMNVTSLNNYPYAAQVLVGAGPVNITNITVDGTGNTLSGSGIHLAGIYYESGSSGVISEVTTRYQLDSGTGTGIWAENNTSGELVTIENSSIHDFDFSGITLNSAVTATVKDNMVDGSNATTAVNGILVDESVSGISASGSITSNIITGPGLGVSAAGISNAASSVSVTDNTITNWYYGVDDFFGATYKSNSVRITEYGISLGGFGSGATVESNTITQANVAINFECNTGTVKSNTINDASTGLFNIPSGVSSTNTYFNVPTIRTDCTGGALNRP